MSKEQHKNTRPLEFFCKYTRQYMFRGRWNWDCKCWRCNLNEACSNCNIAHKATYIKEAKIYRERMCRRCAKKTQQVRERIAANQTEKVK